MRRDDVLNILQQREAQLRELGVSALSIFGSTARQDGRPDSDVDLAVELDEARQITAFEFISIERKIAAMLGVSVDLVGEPARKHRMQAQIDRDRVRVF